MVADLEMISPEDFITRIREIFPEGYEEMSGGCFKFAALLAKLYPQAKGFYDGDHFVTEIDGKLYDINGVVQAEPGDFLEAADFGPQLKKVPRGKELILL